MIKSILLTISISLVFVSCSKSEDFREETKDADHTKPNIIYILADDMGVYDLGCYGQQLIKTPNIDRMANEGMRFTQHYAGSTVCAPSRCALMTGMHTGKAFVKGNFAMENVEYISYVILFSNHFEV